LHRFTECGAFVCNLLAISLGSLLDKAPNCVCKYIHPSLIDRVAAQSAATLSMGFGFIVSLDYDKTSKNLGWHAAICLFVVCC
jgi:hypothetical protein